MLLAILILLLAYCVAFTLPRSARLSFFLLLSIHVFIAAYNCLLDGRLIGSGADAMRFYYKAVSRAAGMSPFVWDIKSLLNGWNGFINIHGLIQYLGGPSLILAHAVSILGCALCMKMVIVLWQLIGGSNRRTPRLLFFYVMMPSVLLNHSYVLREVWQSLAVLLMTCCTIRLATNKAQIEKLWLVVVFSFSIFLHKAMAPILIFIVGAVNFSLSRMRSKKISQFFTVAFLLLIFLIVTAHSSFLKNDEHHSLMAAAESYALGGEKDARAEYGALFEASRPWTLIYTMFSYLAEPLPWRSLRFKDLVSIAENSFRFYLLYLWFVNRGKLTATQKPTVDALVAAWFAIELVWSVGTINWGTASRHHVPAYALLLTAGLYCSLYSDTKQNHGNNPSKKRIRSSPYPSMDFIAMKG